MRRVFLVEDDKKLGEYLVEAFKNEGFDPTWATQAAELEEALAGNSDYQLILLDRLIGSSDTKHAIESIKKKWPESPVLVISAINTANERTELINLGADDYVGKPFSLQELVARSKALLRRPSPPELQNIVLGNTIIDVLMRTVSVDGKTETLPSKEFLLLKTFCSPQGRVFRKEDLLNQVWGVSPHAETNVVESTIAHLRRNLEALGSSLRIKNMRNAGYWVEK
ncbi:MAG: response regulator transcription factor [Bdellovibrionota bacterium]